MAHSHRRRAAVDRSPSAPAACLFHGPDPGILGAADRRRPPALAVEVEGAVLSKRLKTSRNVRSPGSEVPSLSA